MARQSMLQFSLPRGRGTGAVEVEVCMFVCMYVCMFALICFALEPDWSGLACALLSLRLLSLQVVASGRTEEYYIFNEREIMRDLDSAFHVRLVNTYKSAKNLYILMEYAPGHNLKDQIDREDGKGRTRAVPIGFSRGF